MLNIPPTYLYFLHRYDATFYIDVNDTILTTFQYIGTIHHFNTPSLVREFIAWSYIAVKNFVQGLITGCWKTFSTDCQSICDHAVCMVRAVISYSASDLSTVMCFYLFNNIFVSIWTAPPMAISIYPFFLVSKSVSLRSIVTYSPRSASRTTSTSWIETQLNLSGRQTS